ncbi:MAG: hypothetical protein N2556_07900, partial [Anaerolineae bacterium]|nr:hypothetical protein [Anaerolineae bacterium]
MFQPSRSTRERQRLIFGIALWLVIFLLGVFCLWWGFFAPSPETSQPVAETATPTMTVTPAGGLRPLATATPSPGTGSQPTAPLDQEVFGYGIAVHA